MVVVAVVGAPAWRDYFLSLTGKFGGNCKQNPCTDINLPGPDRLGLGSHCASIRTVV